LRRRAELEGSKGKEKGRKLGGLEKIGGVSGKGIRITSNQTAKNIFGKEEKNVSGESTTGGKNLAKRKANPTLGKKTGSGQKGEGVARAVYLRG